MTPRWERFADRMADAVRATLDGRPVPVPAGGELLMPVFADACGGRQMAAHGPQALTLGEIEAAARLHRLELEVRHVAVLRAMDRAWLDRAGQKAKPLAAPLTPGMFDAML
jgi:hypothetical protein